MSFKANDIKVGMIAWFKINDLRNNPNIKCSGGTDEEDEKDTIEKGRPFVCYKAETNSDLCFWTPLTKIEPGEEDKLNSERLEIAMDWVIEHQNSRTPFFKTPNTKCYLNHGNHLYEGTKLDFSNLGKNILKDANGNALKNRKGKNKTVDSPNDEAYRPRINEIGLEEIISEIISQVPYRNEEINDGFQALLKKTEENEI